MSAGVAVELPELVVADAPAWRAWLHEHHTQPTGVWLVLAKKGTTHPTSLSYQQALREALCYGWIDGQGKRRDEQSSLQRMTPRGPRSAWSARNVGHIARLEGENRMTEAGRAVVRAAQADGRWDRAYAGPATAQVPADLAAAIAANPRAQAMFDVLTSTNRFAMIYRLNAVKRAETRTRKIAEFVEMLARYETHHPQRKRPE